MAAVKTTGLGWTTLSVDDSTGTVVDIRADVTNLQFATPRGVQDVTGINKSAYERLLLLADFSITLNGAGFDTQASQAHTTFRTVPSTSVLRTTTIVVQGATLAAETLYTDYSITRAADGGITWTAPGVLGDGNVPTWA
jgi:hypothetical protein